MKKAEAKLATARTLCDACTGEGYIPGGCLNCYWIKEAKRLGAELADVKVLLGEEQRALAELQHRERFRASAAEMMNIHSETLSKLAAGDIDDGDISACRPLVAAERLWRMAEFGELHDLVTGRELATHCLRRFVFFMRQALECEAVTLDGEMCPPCKEKAGAWWDARKAFER